MHETPDTYKSRDQIITVSLVVFGLSLPFPAFFTGNGVDDQVYSVTALLIGWLAAIADPAAFSWLANPLFLAALITLKKHKPVATIVLSMLALSCALPFIAVSEIIVNEAGHQRPITGLGAGYWLWVTSIAIVLASSIVNKLAAKST